MCDRTLIVGGSPAASSPDLVARLGRDCGRIIAVDRGLDVVLDAGLDADLFCGDADSVSEAGAAEVSLAECGEPSRVGRVRRYDPHKDDTDLGLALRALADEAPASTIVCCCLSGGKPDHALAVYGRLMGWEGPVHIEEDAFSARVLRGGERWDLEGRASRRFSFVPVSCEAVVSERGMCWELDRHPVPLLSDLGISNVIESDAASIECVAGALIAWCFA